MLKELLVYSSEVVLSLVLVMVFFLAVMGILNSIFPSGVGLREMMAQDTLNTHTPGTGTEAIAASLTDLENIVKSKRAEQIAWEKALEDMPLYDRDAIQTFQRSSAVIEFDKENYLKMGSNSLVILKRIERDSVYGQRRSFMVIVEGELSGRISAAGMEAVVIEIETPGARMRIPSAEETGKPAEFSITVKPDKTSKITMYEGTAEVEADGKIFTVKKDQSRIIRPLEKKEIAPREQDKEIPPSQGKTEPTSDQVPPEQVLRTMRLSAPDDMAEFFYRDLAPQVVFKWIPMEGGRMYRFIIATDPDLKKKVNDERLKATEFIHGNLRDGKYYWRVIASTEDGMSVESGIRSFIVKQDLVPPRLSVEFPPKMVKEEFAAVRGKAEAGARVFIMGNAVNVAADGSFDSKVQLQQGMNVIVVEAVDMAGNVTYKSSLVNGKF